MRILLVQPDRRSSFGFPALAEPLGLELLAAAVPEHEVTIVDQRLEPLAPVLSEFQPDVVGVTALTPEYRAAAQVLELATEVCPDVVTVCGGYHATLCPRDFEDLPFVDHVITGEGEGKFRALIERQPPDLPFDIPHPARTLVARYREHYHWIYDKPDTSIVTSRGCAFRCSFCSVHKFYKGVVRFLCIDYVLAEIRAAATEHISIMDDSFFLDPLRDAEIARQIEAEGLRHRYSLECRASSIVAQPGLVELWREIGLQTVFLGLESTDDKALKLVQKGTTRAMNDEALAILRANGVNVWGAFIVHPEWGEGDFTRLEDYVRDQQITHTQFTVLTPLPGTELYDQRRGDLLTHDYRAFDCLHAVVATKLSRERFYERLAGLYRSVNAEAIYNAVSAGRLTVEQVRWGAEQLKHLADPWAYMASDPVMSGKEMSSCMH